MPYSLLRPPKTPQSVRRTPPPDQQRRSGRPAASGCPTAPRRYRASSTLVPQPSHSLPHSAARRTNSLVTLKLATYSGGSWSFPSTLHCSSALEGVAASSVKPFLQQLL